MAISARALGPMAAALCWTSAALGYPSVRLAYHVGAGADGCPDEKVLRSEVAVRLGSDPFSTSADRTISLSITRDDNELKARAYWVEASGEIQRVREMAMPLQRCDELVRAVALSISIAIDPASEGVDPHALPVPAEDVPDAGERDLADAPAPASTAAAGPIASPPRPDAATSPRWEVGVGAFASAGTGPGPRLGGMLSAVLRISRFSFGVEPRGEIPATAPSGNFGTSLVELRVVPCIHWPRALFTCLVASPGILSAWGLGSALASRDSATVFGLGARFGIELGLSGPLALRFQGDVVLHLVPVQVTSLGTVLWHDTSRASVSLGPQLVFHFP